jgi:glycogen synthase
VFDGESSRDKAGNFVETVAEALALKVTTPRQWAGIRNQAAEQRFTWDLAARQYQEDLYGHPGR